MAGILHEFPPHLFADFICPTPESSTMLRPAPDVLTFVPGRNDVELNLVFAYQVPAPLKSMVALYKWIPQNENRVEEPLNVSWSESLGSYFSYVPEADAAGLRRGPTIKLPSPGSLEIRLLNWPAKTPALPDVVSGVYAGKRTSESGGSYKGLQRILGNGHDA